MNHHRPLSNRGAVLSTFAGLWALALALLVAPAVAQNSGVGSQGGTSGYSLPDLSHAHFLVNGADGAERPLESMTYAPAYGQDVVITGRLDIPCCAPTIRINVVQPSGGWREWTATDPLTGGFSLRFRPNGSGTYQLLAEGLPNGSTAFRVDVVPVVVIDPAILKTQGRRKRVVPMRPDHRIVVTGWARPKDSTRSGKVRLQYQSRGEWRDLAGSWGVGQDGSWRLTYRLTRPARVDAWMRVAFRPLAQSPETFSAPFVVPLH